MLKERNNEALMVKRIIMRGLKYWPWILSSVLLSLVITFFVNRYSLPVYQIDASIQVKSENSADFPKQLIGMESMQGMMNNTRNEIAILKSYDLVREAVQNIDYEISFYLDEGFRKKEVASLPNVEIIFDDLAFQPLDVLFSVTVVNDSSFRIGMEAEDPVVYQYSKEIRRLLAGDFKLDTIVSEGEWLDLPFARFKLRGKKEMESDQAGYFKFNSLNSQVSEWSHFLVEPLEGTSIINISVKTGNREKGVAFLKSLIDSYLQRGVSRQKRIAVRTIEFIDSQLNELKDSLHISAANIQSSKINRGVLDVDYELEKLKNELGKKEESIALLELEWRYLKYLARYLEKGDSISGLIVPASLEINNKQLQEMLDEVFILSREIKEIESRTLKDTPFLQSRQERFARLKETLKKAVSALIKDNRLKKEEVERETGRLRKELWEMPVNKEFFTHLEKNYEINDALYTMLLTRRSEMEILLASNLPASEIIELPRANRARLVSPDSSGNYKKAIATGLMIPGLILTLIFYFNDKIQSDDELTGITDFPLMGYILESNHSENVIVKNYPNSLVSESFRSFRTNLQFGEWKRSNQHCRTFLVTSGNVGEGKSFISINLAMSLSMTGNKVMLLNFDLRRPKISIYMYGERSEKGVSGFLSGDLTLEQIIQRNKVENLSAIFAGSVPPNPPELMMRRVLMDELFDSLKQEFDYIIVDTPPIGRVADAFLLEKYVDEWLFVIRHNYSRLRNVSRILKDFEQREITKVSLIVNGIKQEKHLFGYSGAYNYGYGYGYGYGNK